MSIVHLELLGTNPEGLVHLEARHEDGTVQQVEIAADTLLDEATLTAALGADLSRDGYEALQQIVLPLIPRRLFRSFTAASLSRIEFEPVRYVIPGVVPEGLAVLAGKPKIGKSWLTMGWALDVARMGSVLYLALEDPPRRLKSRMDSLLAGADAPATLEFRTEWPRLNEGGLQALDDWLRSHPIARLVVIDTIAKIRPPRGHQEDAYLGDYGVWGALQGLLLAHPDVAVVGNHHQRKGEAEDVLDTVLGSQGVTGAVDTVLVLKRDRGSDDGELFVTGRDVEEKERAFSFDRETGWWKNVGDAAEARRSGEMVELLSTLAMAGPQKPRALASLLGLDYHTAYRRLARAKETETVQQLPDGTWDIKK